MAKKSSLPLPETPVIQTMTAADVYKSVFKQYPDVLDVPQVAEAIGISTKQVYRLLNSGALNSLKIGRTFKVPKVYLLHYLKLIDRDKGGV